MYVQVGMREREKDREKRKREWKKRNCDEKTDFSRFWM
jgi:hypothetical protein